MNEAAWLACKRPDKMLTFLVGRVSDRKLRLFAVACCRRWWEWVPFGAPRKAIEIAERFADGQADAQELTSAWDAARASERANAPLDRESFCETAAVATVENDAMLAAYKAAAMMRLPRDTCLPRGCRGRYGGREQDFLDMTRPMWHTLRNVLSIAQFYLSPRLFPGLRSEARAQASVLREIVGNPFRPAPCDPSWRTPDVVRLAEALYEKRDFGHLPILADAVEEAGCSEQEILNHLRGPGDHHRGCWALDAVARSV